MVKEGNSVPNHGDKKCLTSPVNTKGFTFLYYLWGQLADERPFSPSCSFMEVAARGIKWKKDLSRSSRKRKFWFKLKLFHAWITTVVGKGWFSTTTDALDCLEGWRKGENIGLGSLLMMMETEKLPSPRSLAAREVAIV